MGLITYTNLEDGTPVTANVFNERFAQIIAQLNGNLDENNFKDAGISKQKLMTEVYESIYPVGSMYVNFTDNTNPATLLGFGTWTAVAGRMVVGYDASQTEFNAAEKTGGDKKLSKLFMPSRSGVLTINDSNGDALLLTDNAGSNGAYWSGTGTTNPLGGILNPYIVGYVWKRVS